MNKKQGICIVAIGTIAAFLAAAAVTADSSILSTPLYTYRMEQASDTMNFLPTEQSTFTYTAKQGCNLNCRAENHCGEGILSTTGLETCYGYFTCQGYYTCSQTCEGYTHGGSTCLTTCLNWWTCTQYTCDLSCDGYTCVAAFTCMGTCVVTCPETCETCQGQGWTCNATGCQQTCYTCGFTCEATCPATCEGTTCPWTCEETCEDTCEYSCDDTCGKTCDGCPDP
jgi:hypothetical protein